MSKPSAAAPDELLRRIAEQSSDFIAALDPEFRYRALNRAYIREFERIFGTRLEIGMAVPDALAHLPGERDRVMAMFERALRGEEFTAVQPFGDHHLDRRVYEVRFRPLHDEDGRFDGSFHVVRDVTDRKRAGDESALLKSTSLAIAGATTFERALQVVLSRVCEMTGWATGEAWLPDRDGSRLGRGAVAEGSDERLRRFHEASESYAFAPGEGLPGRVWQSRRAEWLKDVSTSPHFLRAGLAVECGLKAAVVVPAIADGEVVAVLCFYHYEVRTEDAALVELVSAVAAQLGSLIRRRRSEAHLRRVTAQHTALLNNIPDLAWLKDRDSRYVAVNEAFARKYGLAAEEIIGRSDRDIYPAEVAERYIEEDRRVLERGERMVIEERDLHVEGGVRYFETIKTPFRADDGDFAGTVGVARDVTERKRREDHERLLADAGLTLASSLDFRDTVRSVARLVVPHLGTWCVVDILDDEGRFRSAEIVAATPATEELLRLMRSSHPLHSIEGRSPICEVARAGEPRILPRITDAVLHDATDSNAEHLALLRRLGPVSSMIVPLITRGRTVGVLTVSTSQQGRTYGERDLALVQKLARYAALAIDNAMLYRQAQEAQEKAEEAVRARNEMLAVVAHDLRNPLTAISLISSLLETGDQQGAPEDHLRTIQQLTDQMDRLIQDLLDLRRLEVGALPLQPTPLAARSALEAIVNTLAPVAAENDVGLEILESPSDLQVNADPDRLQQVLSNLVGNAIKFSPAGARVALRAGAEDGEVVFAVTDRGPGIADDHLPHLFEQFWQAEGERRRGAGLGLTIAKGIVEAHGGRIRVESALGKGSTFFVALPAATPAESTREPEPEEVEVTEAADTAASERSSEAGDTGERTNPIRVLLVDDHAVLLAGLRQMLGHADDVVVVGEVSSGEEAVEAVQKLGPDLVVMDLKMPGMGGLEATRRIYAHDHAPRVLALTSDTEEESLLPVLAAGGSGYVRKTRAATDLLEAIRAVARDETFLYPSATKLLLHAYRESTQQGAHPSLAQLGEREQRMLRLIAEGYTSREIGKKLFLSPATVDTYRHQLMKKMGLSHRSDVVQFALRTGLLKEG
jgi:PAS domain S-box-containing protein